MTNHDDIGKALAAEEHKQGLAVGGDPDHCDRCWDADIDRRRAECEHAEETDIRTLGDPLPILLCLFCGRTRKGTA